MVVGEPGLDLAIRPNAFRFLAYSLLVVLLLVSMILTMVYTVPAGVLDLHDNMIHNTFGYINVCVFIDDLPAKYVAIYLWSLFVLAWCTYELLEWVRIRGQYQLGYIAEGWYRTFTAITVFDVFAVTYSISIFAVHPKENFLMHTIPFSLAIAMVSLHAIRNVIFGLDAVKGTGFGYSSLKIPATRWYTVGSYAYVFFLVLNSIMHVTFDMRGIIFHKPPPVWLGHSNDLVWVAVALVIPWGWSGYIFMCGNDVVHINFKPSIEKPQHQQR